MHRGERGRTQQTGAPAPDWQPPRERDAPNATPIASYLIFEPGEVVPIAQKRPSMSK